MSRTFSTMSFHKHDNLQTTIQLTTTNLPIIQDRQGNPPKIANSRRTRPKQQLTFNGSVRKTQSIHQQLLERKRQTQQIHR
jgi:hypothetical protein